MRAFKRICKVMFAVSVVVWPIAFLLTPPLPKPGDISENIRSAEPLQENTTAVPFSSKIGKFTYSFDPKFAYDMYGLVVSVYDARNIFDFAHRADPGNIKDVCIVWGDNVQNGSYRDVAYSHGEFTCYVSWDRTLAAPFLLDKIANNHMIPASDSVAQVIDKMAVGDQVHFKGMLVNYSVKTREGEDVFTRNTSTTRSDTGNGACEIVYVTQAKVLKAGMGEVFDFLRVAALWIGAASLLALVLMFIAEVRRDRPVKEPEPEKTPFGMS